MDCRAIIFTIAHIFLCEKEVETSSLYAPFFLDYLTKGQKHTSIKLKPPSLKEPA
jgi:hypothetical protein